MNESRMSTYWATMPFPELLEHANAGEAEAQVVAGYRYLMGVDGAQKDLALGVAYTRKAADQGQPSAIGNLGNCYKYGIGVEPNDEQAFTYLEEAAQLGDIHAQTNLGQMYIDGKGCDRNLEAAFEWFEHAAKRGHAIAQYKVGNCYYSAQGVAEDKRQALKWYVKAAQQEVAAAIYNVGVMLNNSEDFSLFNPEKAAECFYRASRQNIKNAKDDWEIMHNELMKTSTGQKAIHDIVKMVEKNTPLRFDYGS